MKIAYPNFDSYVEPKPTYDLSKWVKCMNQIKMMAHAGENEADSFDTVTSGWNKTEKNDFKQWMKFYEEGAHLKYKVAQYYVNEDIPQYFIPNPIKAPENKEVSPSQNHYDKMNSDRQDMIRNQEKRKIIEEQRRKLLGRLNAAEKLLASQEGHIFAGAEFEKLLNSMYELKKQVQTINKVSVSSDTYNDLIIREANKLSMNGFKKSADFLVKLAQQTPGNFDANQGPLPLGNKIDGTGTLENPTPTIESLTAKNPVEEKQEKEDAIDGLLDNMQSGTITEDISEIDDVEIEKDVLIDDCQDSDDGFISEAQVSPQDAIIERKEQNFDSIIDSAFANITIYDAIKKLEDVSAIFKNRQISKEIAIIDLMLSKLGLTTFFPSLGEAASRNLETNQYCLTRIEDILGKLRGSVDSNNIKLAPSEQAVDEMTKNVQKTLDVENEKEKARKNLRKKVQDEDLEEKAIDAEKEPLEVEDIPETIENSQPNVPVTNAPSPPTKPVSPTLPVR